MKRSLWKPYAIADSVQAIPWEELWREGVRGILVDLDNTLAPWDHASSEVPEAARAWLGGVQALGFSVCLISNGGQARVSSFADALGIAYVASASKPAPRGYRKALAALSLAPMQCVAVGDQLLTDIVGAQRMGIRAFLVKPLSEKEMIFTRFNRVMERVLLSLAGAARMRKER